MQKVLKIKSLIQFYLNDTNCQRLGKRAKTMHITGASCVGSSLIACGKMFLGVTSFSFFMCVSAMYTSAIVLAKAYVLYGIADCKDHFKQQYAYCQRSGKLLVIAGTAYMIYSIKLLFFPVEQSFSMNEALLIACFTFVELGLNIRGIIVERKHQMPLFHALKIINLASSCICLVLTQTALLAYTSAETGIVHDAVSNGYIGVCMGVIATMLGVYLILRANAIVLGKDKGQLTRKLRHHMKKQGIIQEFEIKSIQLREDGKREAVLQVEKRIEEETYKKIIKIAFEQMKLVIILKHDTLKERELVV